MFEDNVYHHITCHLNAYIEVGGKNAISKTYIDDEIKRVTEAAIQDEANDNWDELLEDGWENDAFTENIAEFGTLYQLYNINEAQEGK